MSGGGRYPVPAGTHRVEQSIERSRFITTVAQATTPDEAQAFIRAVSAEFADATHNCWAFVAGPPGSTSHIGMSDDGEPHGTAGRPMLTVLLHAGLGEVVAVVTRYFGGTKLGTGGLARAYSSSVQQALESVPRAERVDWREATIVVGYANIAAIKQLLPLHEAEVLAEDFGADVRFTVRAPEVRIAALCAAVADATRGQGSIRVAGDE